MQTVYGIVADEIGAAWDGGKRFWATPSTHVRTVQDGQIPIDQNHDGRPVGEVIDLQRHGGNIWCVGEVHDHVTASVSVRVGTEVRAVPHDLFWSSSRIGDLEKGFVFDSVTLTTSPARVISRPVVFRDGNAHMAAYTSHDRFERELLYRADAARSKRHGGPIIVRDQAGVLATDPASTFRSAHSRTRIETRSAELGDVSVDRREITAIVAPYESPTVVTFKGRRVYEMFLTGCFDGVPDQPNTIRLNRDHKAEKVVGRAISWDTRRHDGLVGTFRIPRTRDGDEVLELCAEDLVDCSVGFGATSESWPQQDMRLINKGFIDHVAVTSMPAYKDARVLSVTGATQTLS